MSGTLTPGSPPETANGAYAPEAVPPSLPTDQEQFDAAVNRDGKIVLQILAGVAVLAALAMSTVALVLSSGKGNTTATVTQTTAAAVPSASGPSPVITLSVAGSIKQGPDGKMHDAFSKTNFALKVGQPTRLRIDNRDASTHSITSVAAGVSVVVLPGVHTYTIVAKTAGRFEWICIIPCDSDAKGWAMSQPGYMAGYITAT
jgi:plastocyanin